MRRHKTLVIYPGIIRAQGGLLACARSLRRDGRLNQDIPHCAGTLLALQSSAMDHVVSDGKMIVRQRYEALVKLGRLERHPAQQRQVDKMNGLARRLTCERSDPGRRSAWRCRTGETGLKNGLYIHGPVGSGKTMLLDLFYGSVEGAAKRRLHIHEFLAQFHARQEADGPSAGPQPGKRGAGPLFGDVKLLCIDEVAVSDIGDATILRRVLSDLLAQGTILVMTANVAPDDLYEGGLNRVLFTPLVHLLTDALEVMRLDTGSDFRRRRKESEPVWFVPADGPANEALDAAFARLTGGAAPEKLDVAVRGHQFTIRRQARGVARFSFRELCLAPLWTADYRVLAQTFHTVLIEGIPARFAHRNHARRFCALIDIFHEFGVKLMASADSEPDQLYAGMAAAFQPAVGPPSPTSETSPEMLEFKRTVSRLHEMRSGFYAASRWRGEKLRDGGTRACAR